MGLTSAQNNGENVVIAFIITGVVVLAVTLLATSPCVNLQINTKARVRQGPRPQGIQGDFLAKVRGIFQIQGVIKWPLEAKNPPFCP